MRARSTEEAWFSWEGWDLDPSSGQIAQVEGEGAAALVHLLDEVLADAGEAQHGVVVAVEAVAREDEEHDVEEELGEGVGVLGARAVLDVHVCCGLGRLCAPRV